MKKKRLKLLKILFPLFKGTDRKGTDLKLKVNFKFLNNFDSIYETDEDEVPLEQNESVLSNENETRQTSLVLSSLVKKELSF